MPPLTLPRHSARDDTPGGRGGVAAPGPGGAPEASGFVDVGLQRLVEVDHLVEPAVRVTVDLTASGPGYSVPGRHLFGQVVARSAPRDEEGVYWGYDVRVASGLLDAMDSSAEGAKYDLVVGTSDKGDALGAPPGAGDMPPFALPGFRHALIMFGGVAGLEHSASFDDRLSKLSAKGGPTGTVDPAHPSCEDLFDFYVNTCPGQGSRTIRTEEAIPITLANLRPFLRPLDS